MAPTPSRQEVGFSARRAKPLGRPPVRADVEELVVQLAQENPGWGYDRLVGAPANLGHQVSDHTIGNILRRHGLGSAPERKRQTTWPEFIRRHKEVLWATDFFTAQVWSASGLITVYVLFLIQLQTRKVVLGGLTSAPTRLGLNQSRATSPGSVTS